jgi:hypothetical protein
MVIYFIEMPSISAASIMFTSPAPSGSGKSWIKNNIIYPLLGGFAIYPTGDATTEAGIRQTLKGDALAIVHDEAESSSEVGKRTMQNKLLLARASSTDDGSSVMKGTQDGSAMHYALKSAFCFVSIGVPQLNKADDSRFSVVSILESDRIKNAKEQFANLKKYCALVDFEKLRSRFISMAPITNASSIIFQKVVYDILGNNRNADQLSSIFAGYWSLNSNDVVTEQQAYNIVSELDLSDYTQKQDSDMLDHNECLSNILGMIPKDSQLSIGEMIEDNTPQNSLILRRFGIAVLDEKQIWFANKCQNLEHLLKDTKFATTYKNELKRIEGYESSRRAVKVNGFNTKGYTIPLTALGTNTTSEVPENDFFAGFKY